MSNRFQRVIQVGAVSSALFFAACGVWARTPPAAPAKVAGAASEVFVLRAAQGKPVTSLRVTKDGKTAFVSANTGQVEVYDLTTRSLVRALAVDMGAYELAVSPDASASAGEVAASTIDFWVSLFPVSGEKERTRFFLKAVGGASGLDWAPDGQTLACASSNQVALFNRSGDLVASFQNPKGSAPNTVAFSPDGTRLVAGWSDRALVVYDATNFDKPSAIEAFKGPQLREVARLEGHENAVTALAWSKDGKFLASGDAGGQVQLWDFALQKKLASWTVADAQVMSLAWAPGGASVAVAAKTLQNGAAVQLWDVAKDKAKLVWKSNRPALQVAFAADGKTLVVGDAGGAVSLVPVGAFEWFKTSSPKPLTFTQPLVTLPGALDVEALAWSSDGRLFANAGKTQLQVRDLRSGALVRVPQTHTQNITDVAFSPDNALLVTSGYDGVEVADVTSGTKRWKRDQRAVVAGWSSDGKTLYIAESDNSNQALKNEIVALDARTGAVQKVVGILTGTFYNSPLVARLSPDKTRVAVGVFAKDNGRFDTSTLQVWDIASARLLWNVSLDGRCDALAWSSNGGSVVAKVGERANAYPDGDKFVAGKMGVGWFDAATGKRDARTRLDLTDEVEALEFSPGGQSLAVAFTRGPAQLWNTTGTLKNTLESSANIRAWAFSGDGKHLAGSGSGSPLRFWTPSQGF